MKEVGAGLTFNAEYSVWCAKCDASSLDFGDRLILPSRVHVHGASYKVIGCRTITCHSFQKNSVLLAR